MLINFLRLLNLSREKAYATISTLIVEITQLKQATTKVLIYHLGKLRLCVSVKSLT